MKNLNLGRTVLGRTVAHGLAWRHKQHGWPVRYSMARVPGVVTACAGASGRRGRSGLTGGLGVVHPAGKSQGSGGSWVGQ
jgi:hypothetical protein